MTTLARIVIAALIATAVSACTPAAQGGAGLVPATRLVQPQDSNGGLPPKATPATPAP